MNRFLILLLLFSTRTFAFNPESCKAEFNKKYRYDQTAWMTTSTSDSTTLLTDATILPTVAVNATRSKNGCSIENKSYADMAEYFSSNYEVIKIECARGGGEFTAGLARLFRCPDDIIPKFNEDLKKWYKGIFESEFKHTKEESFHSLVYFLQPLKSHCPNIGAFNYIRF